MQANRNTVQSLRIFAASLGLRAGELLQMAREAEHSELMPSLAHLSHEGALRLKADLERIARDRAWLSQLTNECLMMR